MMQLCRLAELRERGSLGFSLEFNGQPLEGFVVYREGTLSAYLNRCPHTGAPLNWSPHLFLSPEGRHIQCALHGALFRIADGVCEYGPCRGDSLLPLVVTIQAQNVVLLEQSVPLPS